MTTYKIIESSPYDKGAPSTFWIKREVKWFNFTTSSTLLGDYKYDNAYGELGDCPFFDRDSAEKRISIWEQ